MRLLSVLLALSVACAPTIQTQFSAAPGAARPAVPAANVRVIDLRGKPPSALPDGFALKDAWSNKTNDLDVAADIPTPNQPNRRIGAIEVGGWARNARAPSDLPQRLATEAGVHGANTVVLLSDRKAIAIWMSSAQPVHATVAQLITDAQAKLASYTAGAPRSLQLQEPGRIHLDAAKGHCYAMIIALDPTAAWFPTVREVGLQVSMDATDGWLAYTGKPDIVETNAATARRSAAIELACALEDTRVELAFEQTFGGKLLRAIGTGTAQLVVLDKTLDAAALEALKRHELAGLMFNSIPDHRDSAAAERDCIVCAGSVGQCKTGNVEACALFQACLLDRKHDTRVSYCLRAR
jgi:hypothetical protein